MSGRMVTPEQLAAIQLRAKGVGKRGMGKCALCHGIESGNSRQPFPVSKGKHFIAGYKLCDSHHKTLMAIAQDAGVPSPLLSPT